MQVKHMTESQLFKIINNGYVGDPVKGYGTDYNDYRDEINERYWQLTSDKVMDDFNDKLKQLEECEITGK